MEAPSLSVEPLIAGDAVIQPAAVRVYRIHFLDTPPLPGWHIKNIPPRDRVATLAEALVPINAPFGGMPEELVPGATFHFFAEVRVPKGTFHERYLGGLELRQGGAVLARLPFAVEVLPLTLPAAPWSVMVDLDHRALIEHHIRDAGRPLKLAIDEWTDHPMRDELDMQVRVAAQMLARHGLTPLMPHLSPGARVEPTGKIRLDWRTYDRLAEPCLSGAWSPDRKPVFAWAAPVSWPRHPDTARPEETRRDDAFQDYFGSIAAHFADRGWASRAYFDVDGVISANKMRGGAFPAILDHARRRGPGMRLLTRQSGADALPHSDSNEAPESGAAGDIHASPASLLPAKGAAEPSPVGPRWMTLDHPPFSASLHAASPPSHLLSLGWQLDAMDVDATLLGPINNWPDAALRPTPAQCLAKDPTVLFYPGAAFGLIEPVPSLRLKLVQRSLQDAAYCALLRDKGLGHVADALRAALIAYVGAEARRNGPSDGRPIGWTEAERAYSDARDIMIDALLEGAQPVGADGPRADFTRSATWRRFMLETRRFRLSVDGCRVRRSSTPEWELSCTASMDNRSRLPVDGVLSITDESSGSAVGWGAATIEPIPPGASRRATLALATDRIAPNREGIALAWVSFAPRDGEAAKTRARVALAVAAQTPAAIHIDGDLSDWPVADGNAAGDFRLVAARNDAAELPIDALPALRTTAFVLRQRNELVFGVHCQTAGQVPVASRTNVVSYDDMIPVGDELIEILLDPANAGTRDANDIHRLTVKASGAYSIGRGVPGGDIEAPAAPWTVDARIAVQHASDRWTVEVAIPLAAFGAHALDGGVWGFNVTRFDAAHSEFSNWSGARGNVYDPLSLGNLDVPASPE